MSEHLDDNRLEYRSGNLCPGRSTLPQGGQVAECNHGDDSIYISQALRQVDHRTQPPNQRLKLKGRGGRLKREGICLVCGRRRPQLKCDPLGCHISPFPEADGQTPCLPWRHYRRCNWLVARSASEHHGGVLLKCARDSGGRLRWPEGCGITPWVNVQPNQRLKLTARGGRSLGAIR